MQKEAIDVLLINPPYRFKKKFFEFDVNSTLDIMPPLSLAYLGASCIKTGHSVKIFDMEAEIATEKSLIRTIERHNPKIIGITCLSSLLKSVITLSKIIKKNFNIPVVVGGAHARIDPEGLIKIESIDYVLQGEGEYNLPKLLDFLIDKKGDLKEINSLIYKRDGKILHNPFSGQIDDIDVLPFPDRSLFNNNLYFLPFMKGKKTTSIISSRGCPYNCNFCNPQYKKVKKRSVKKIILEIKGAISKYNIEDFQFFDETFNLDPKWVNDFCDELLKQNIKINFKVRMRPDLITDEMIRKLEKAGCYMISLGIESANNKTLGFFRKGYTIEQVKGAIHLIKKRDIQIHGFFILGSPTESKEDMLRTINFAKNSGVDFAIFALLLPVPGTDFYKQAIKKGWYNDHDKYDYSEHIGGNEPLLEHPTLSKPELMRLYRKAFFSFYSRPKSFFKLVKLFMNLYVLPKVIKRHLINN